MLLYTELTNTNTFPPEHSGTSPTYFPQQMHKHTHTLDQGEWSTEILFVNNLEESSYLGPVYSWKNKPYLCEESVLNQTS